jgi:hypothetical protein
VFTEIDRREDALGAYTKLYAGTTFGLGADCRLARERPAVNRTSRVASLDLAPRAPSTSRVFAQAKPLRDPVSDKGSRRNTDSPQRSQV